MQNAIMIVHGETRGRGQNEGRKDGTGNLKSFDGKGKWEVT